MDKKKILVVDDQREVQLLLQKRLEAAGYNIVQAWDGEQALWKVVEERPDLVLTDIVMPKMSGIELVKKLRGIEGTENLPIIVISNRSLMVDCFEPGVIEGFFAKPFDMDGMIKKIADIFEKQELLKTLEDIQKRDEKRGLLSGAKQDDGIKRQEVCKKCGSVLTDDVERCPNCGSGEFFLREVYD